jgi:hypothetical protein
MPDRHRAQSTEHRGKRGEPPSLKLRRLKDVRHRHRGKRREPPSLKLRRLKGVRHRHRAQSSELREQGIYLGHADSRNVYNSVIFSVIS